MRAVIWGLKTATYHTHRYIHSSFYEAFSKMGWETFWVDDNPDYAHLVKRDSVVLALGGYAQYLPLGVDARFILHNFDAKDWSGGVEFPKRYLRLQVFTKEAEGNKLTEDVISVYSEKTNTLFQPWGLPQSDSIFLNYNPNPGLVEFWVGSIWNNKLNQGNMNEIRSYKTSLCLRKIKFRQVGSEAGCARIMRAFRMGIAKNIAFGLSEAEARYLVHVSPVGASIVGDWQKQSGYIPCRVFKNIASGQPLFSNSDFSLLFGESASSFEDINELIDRRLSLPTKLARRLVADAQREVLHYSYAAAIERILRVLP